MSAKGRNGAVLQVARPPPSGQEEEALGFVRRALRNPHGTCSERRDRFRDAWSSLRSAAGQVASKSKERHAPKRKDRIQKRMKTAGLHKVDEKGPDERVQMLLKASQTGHAEQVSQLLQDGVKVTAKDDLGYTALHWASLHGHTEVVRVLLGSGAGDGSRIDRKSKSGNTALHFACSGQHAEVASILSMYQPDAHAVNNCGQTPVSLGLRKLAGRLEDLERTRQVQATRNQAPYLRLQSAGLEMRMNAQWSKDAEAGSSRGELQQNIMILWDSYQSAWAEFAAKFANAADSELRGQGSANAETNDERVFGLRDVPWPYRTSMSKGTPEKSELLLAQLTVAGNVLRTLVQQERLRWHPDKFGQMFGRHMLPKEKEEIMSGVQAVCQQINAIASQTVVC